MQSEIFILLLIVIDLKTTYVYKKSQYVAWQGVFNSTIRKDDAKSLVLTCDISISTKKDEGCQKQKNETQ